MTPMKTPSALGLLALASLLAACASAPDAPGGSTATTAQATTADPAADLSGTWGFVLASSDVAGPVRERCDKSSGGDAAKAKECLAEITAQAAKEKIRFSKDAAGHVVWTSFETDGGKELVYVQVPVELATDGPGRVLAKVAGTPQGEMAEKFKQSSTNAMVVEVVDARTIAMTDPRKGRLVYTKE
jgi:hypothetical protein